MDLRRPKETFARNTVEMYTEENSSSFDNLDVYQNRPEGALAQSSREMYAGDDASTFQEMDHDGHNTKSTKTTNIDDTRARDMTPESSRLRYSQQKPNIPVEALDYAKMPHQTHPGGYDTMMKGTGIHEPKHNNIIKTVQNYSTFPDTPKPTRRSTHSARYRQGPKEDPRGLLQSVIGGFKEMVSPSKHKSDQQQRGERVGRSVDSNNLGRETRNTRNEQNAQNLGQREEINYGSNYSENNNLRQEAENQEHEEEYGSALEAERQSRDQITEEFNRKLNNMQHVHNNEIQNLLSRLKESESREQDQVEQLNAFVFKQQEATLQNMAPARWLPDDERDVRDKFQALHVDMKNWARGAAAKDNSVLSALEKDDHAMLMREISKVALLEQGNLPRGVLATAKCPVLLLRALLAHHVYTSFFQSPFFFLADREITNDVENLPPRAAHRRDDCSMGQEVLDTIYREAQKGNEEEAHTWRSQTLRMLMPPIERDSSNALKQLRHRTEQSIARAANRRAEEFLASPAHHLLGSDNNETKLKSIFKEAANMAFNLWTRRINIRVFTIHDYEDLQFDADSILFEPDALVRHTRHENNLRGNKVTLLAHPLLKVYGTDEAKDYDQERVWAKGVVWLDSKVYQENRAE